MKKHTWIHACVQIATPQRWIFLSWGRHRLGLFDTCPRDATTLRVAPA
jgi:hypothetical protein